MMFQEGRNDIVDYIITNGKKMDMNNQFSLELVDTLLELRSLL